MFLKTNFELILVGEGEGGGTDAGEHGPGTVFEISVALWGGFELTLFKCSEHSAGPLSC